MYKKILSMLRVLVIFALVSGYGSSVFSATAGLDFSWTNDDGTINLINRTTGLDFYVYAIGSNTSDRLKIDDSFTDVYFTMSGGSWWAGLSNGALTLELNSSADPIEFGYLFNDGSGMDPNYDYIKNSEQMYDLVYKNQVVISIDAVPTPLPGALIFFGSGVLALVGLRRRAF